MARGMFAAVTTFVAGAARAATWKVSGVREVAPVARELRTVDLPVSELVAVVAAVHFFSTDSPLVPLVGPFL